MANNIPCIVSGCIEYAIFKGRCRKHKQEAYVTNFRKERLPADWKQLREFILHRDKGICYLCGEKGADTVDHVLAGDDHSPSNLKAVHDIIAPHCHRFKTSQEGNDAKREQRVKQWGNTWAEEYYKRNNKDK